MARRLTLEGAKVLACVEVQPFSGGLTRNIVQCLEDFDIPLYLSHTITNITGKTRVEKAVVQKVDEHRNPVPGTEMEFDCDTILLSVGLIPENELTKKAGIMMDPHTKGAVVFENRETSLPGVFACGNAVHVHDLVDYVTDEAQIAGRGAASYITDSEKKSAEILKIATGSDVGYTVPQRIRPQQIKKSVEIYFRVRSVHNEPASIVVTSGKKEIARFTRQHLAPGEMERITIAKGQIESCTEDLSIGIAS
jgi:NADH dehydrogenase FAD-containing subunit